MSSPNKTKRKRAPNGYRANPNYKPNDPNNPQYIEYTSAEKEANAIRIAKHKTKKAQEQIQEAEPKMSAPKKRKIRIESAQEEPMPSFTGPSFTVPSPPLAMEESGQLKEPTLITSVKSEPSPNIEPSPSTEPNTAGPIDAISKMASSVSAAAASLYNSTTEAAINAYNSSDEIASKAYNSTSEAIDKTTDAVSSIILPKKEDVLDQLEESVQYEPSDMAPRNAIHSLLAREKYEYDENLRLSADTTSFLYPDLNDPNFNIKIATRKEFYDTRYDGDNTHNIAEKADELCRVKFELMPHQLFVKNFLSFQTPYNSLLLYHGLGSGKTCSAIGIAEEMRSYMKQVGIKPRIMVIASPNVQGNFRLQLFDERKLVKLPSGLWNINSCVGNALLSEINPTNLTGLTKDAVRHHVNSIINTYYVFMGYSQLANHISQKIEVSVDAGYTDAKRNSLRREKIRRYFNNRLIIIDEVHNIRLTDENKNKDKKTTVLLKEVAKYSENMRLLLLSATPMYNSYKEAIWLTNLMNINDKRAPIETSDVFTSDGSWKLAEDSEYGESGKALLKRKLLGYVSYVRGENPYSFPFRVYPALFSPLNSVLGRANYPTKQLNGKPTVGPNDKAEDGKIQFVDIYMNNIGKGTEKNMEKNSVLGDQSTGYRYIIENMKHKSFNTYNAKGELREMPSFENMDAFGYTLLQAPLEALNMIYPNELLDQYSESYDFSQEEFATLLTGKRGLANTMIYEEVYSPQPARFNFEYKKNVLDRYGKIFGQENIGKYSHKIASICDIVRQSTGIVLIYSQYIDGGVVPMALALEEMGFARYGSTTGTKNLLKKRKPAIVPIDSATMFPKTELENPHDFTQAKYVMITGDKAFSPNNNADIKYVTHPDNSDGNLVKVILISKAGSEGLDFKNIRQVHVLEPWYNMNRIEQIIGRGVRNLSHCSLPFSQRNVEIYLHATYLDSDEEAADLYVYRLAERKAIQIGQVTRVLKTVSVDCHLNIEQTNFSAEKWAKNGLTNQTVQIQLSSRGDEMVSFVVGDKPHTDICDYMDNCSFQCSQADDPDDDNELGQPIVFDNIVPSTDTYNSYFIQANQAAIMERIRQLFREPVPPKFDTLIEERKKAGEAEFAYLPTTESRHVFYTRGSLIRHINQIKEYPIEQIYYVLTRFINSKNEYLTDHYGRMGNLANRGQYYYFKPVEISDERTTVFDISNPVDYKRGSLFFELEAQKKLDEISLSKSSLKQSELEKPAIPYTDIIKDIESRLLLASTPHTKIKEITKKIKEDVTGLDNGWYYHMSHNRIYGQELQTEHGIPEETVRRYIVYHYLDLLGFEQKMILIQNLENLKLDTSEIVEAIEQYFDDRLVPDKSNRREAVVLNNGSEFGIYLKPENPLDSWPKLDAEDLKPFQQNFAAKYVIQDKSRINDIVGFISDFKGANMVFKVKDTKQRRNNKGARCDSAGKIDIIKLLNAIQSDIRYTDANTDDIHQNGLCIITEILMRYFTEQTHGNRLFFLNAEQATLNDIANYSQK
jgi:superfamily II DNA or RNA helicase